MSIENAKAYMKRMREDDEFRKRINDEPSKDKNWAYLKSQGYEFSYEEFLAAQNELVDKAHHEETMDEPLK